MPILLSEETNELQLVDHISGSEVVFTYRMPTTEEREGYQNMSIQRKRNALTFNTIKARQKYGASILTGIRDGDFQKRVANGDVLPISSDPNSADYDPDWKKSVERYAGHLVQLLAGHVFDAPATVEDGSLEKN